MRSNASAGQYLLATRWPTNRTMEGVYSRDFHGEAARRNRLYVRRAISNGLSIWLIKSNFFLAVQTRFACRIITLQTYSFR